MDMTKSEHSHRKGQLTRELIVREAAQLARAQGLDALTIGGVASAVKMSKSGVFAHFGAREDLQLAVLEAATQEFGQRVFYAALKHRRGLPRLHAILQNMITFYREIPHGCIILSAAHEFDDRPGAVRDAVVSYLQRLRAELERAVSHALDAGELRQDADIEQLAFELFGVFLAVHHGLKTMREARAAEQGLRAIESILARYIASTETT